MTPEQALAERFSAPRPDRIGLAVSGGGDSMALMVLAHNWAAQNATTLEVATVDHRLRPEAAGEARTVAREAAALGLAHTTLVWQEAPGTGNLQDAARRARYGLLGEWARARGLDAVALGHTLDDQAETFLMRLARGSGVDGLAAMRADWQADGIRWLRPLLPVRRQALRNWLTMRAISWVDDPSNDDLVYTRVRARRALKALAPLEIDAESLVATAKRLHRAREALAEATFQAACAHCRTQSGDVLFDAEVLALPEEILTRLCAHALGWVSSNPYRPRYAALTRALADVQAKKRTSLHGCLISPEQDGFRISREYQAVKDFQAKPKALWDQRWRLHGPGQGVTIRALGEALESCPDWRETGLARASLQASPAAFIGPRLHAAPLAGMANGWSAEFDPTAGDFTDTLLFH